MTCIINDLKIDQGNELVVHLFTLYFIIKPDNVCVCLSESTEADGVV